MLFHHNKPQTRLAGWTYFAVIALFASIATTDPKVGFAGLGASLILGSILVEANKDRIWNDYKKTYKKRPKSRRSYWTQPNESVYRINVLVVWPALFFVGLGAIYAAYLTGR